MNTNFAKVLTSGPLFKVEGVLHIRRTSSQDVECKLLTGRIEEFGSLSAIREVADAEEHEGFVPSKAAYQAIAKAVESLADVAGSEFAGQYREVAGLVREHADTLS